ADGVAVPVGVLKEASFRFFWQKTGAPQSFPQQEKKSGGEQLSWCLNASATLDTVQGICRYQVKAVTLSEFDRRVVCLGQND
ncbi:hypothetical protein H0E87_030643, partial [Populus deltoides]